jgi:hypothetical protein
VLTTGDSFRLPRLIPAGNGGTIQITEEIDDLITRLARELKTKRPTLTRSIKDSEWRNWVRATIGPLLAGASLKAAASGTECRSNAVSGRGLPKTGIFRHAPRDFRRFRRESGQIRSLETDNQFAKARCWRHFSD